MKSTETYKVIRNVLAQWFKSQHFCRAKKGALSWVKPLGADFLVVWFQTESGGYDWALGCSFTMEFQISPSPHLGAYGDGCTRHRLPNMLTDEELEHVRTMQNSVRARMAKPPPHHWIYQQRQHLIDYVLSQFEPIQAWTHPNYKNLLWFQYKNEEDVRLWAEFILGLLPVVVHRMEQEHSGGQQPEAE